MTVPPYPIGWVVRLIVFTLALAALVSAINTHAALARPTADSTYQKWIYPVPVDPDTQSGMPILDAQGRVFSVVRDDGHLQVYRDADRMVNDEDGYGAVEAYIAPNDGCLYVSALKGRTPPRREWVFIRVPGFRCFSFISRASVAPLVLKDQNE